ncbi:MAG: DEAD/DEAH box helicase [Planctomycetes bacterium]|nr:DEAD/DEAH box helicase [Planctomycetota bacterium]
MTPNPANGVRSIRHDDLVIAADVRPWGNPTLPRPPALRLPVAGRTPTLVRIDPGFSRPRVASYHFTPPVAALPPAAPRTARPTIAVDESAGSVSPAPTAGRTRIAPPRDVVKLSEKFFYLLQPDLQTMLHAGRLEFPRKPFPFQLDGMAFLVPRHSAVLADEMGLGKSMQAISSIRLLVRSGEARRVLVVCPKGLVSNWARELADWAPELVVAVIEGDQLRRRWQWSLADVPVKLANYEVLVRDRDLVAQLGLSFDLVVLDEAQRIKNRWSQTNQAVRGLDRRRSWALTGTPIENSADDLVGIFEFVDPGHLNERMTPRALGAAVSDQILRRTKDKVLKDMPPRLNRDERIELGPEQRETYRRAEEEGVLRLSGMGDEATIQHVFELVLRLKQICNFDTATGESAKLDCLQAELEEVQASGRKALVFSQWVETLGRLEISLARFGALQYHGGMSTAARDEAIRRFRQEKRHSVLLLSYGAGAVGLNLQFAQYVFLFDRWWNPAVEDQAINRAHRIGAAGAVTVTRFLSAETIEERIDEVLRRKRDLSEAILSQAGEPAATGLTADELFALFRLAAPRAGGRAAAA